MSSLFVPGGQTFCLSPGDKHFLYTGGTNISYTQRRGEGGGNNLFVPRGQTFLYHSGGGQTFSVEGGGDNYDVYGEDERDVSEANILASEASKLSAGARILRGPWGPEILVYIYDYMCVWVRNKLFVTNSVRKKFLAQ